MNKKNILLAVAVVLCVAVQAQIYPYVETFDTVNITPAGNTVNLNGRAGFTATNNLKIASTRGIGGTNCIQAAMSTFAKSDSLISPLIGPLTTKSKVTFYYRVIGYIGGTPTTYAMGPNDRVDFYVNCPAILPNNWFNQYTVTLGNQNAGTTFVKVEIPVPSLIATYSGLFKIKISNPAGNDWTFHLDSLVVKDTITPGVITVRDTVTAINCKNGATGIIKLGASGGTAPYHYAWAGGGPDTAVRTGLSAGSYIVTVSDAASNFTIDTVRVNEPGTAMSVDSIVKTKVACYGGSNGAIKIYVKGGTPLYAYQWTTVPIQGGQQAVNIPAGSYTVTVTDSKGCTISATDAVTQPSAALHTSISATSTMTNTGTATVTPSGGTSPYRYAWNDATTSGTLTGLAPGCYKVTVTDAGGCQVVDSVCIFHTGIIDAEVSSAIKLYPNPASQSVQIDVYDATLTYYDVEISDMTGRKVIYQADTQSGAVILTNGLMPGIYLVRIGNAEKSYIKRLTVR